MKTRKESSDKDFFTCDLAETKEQKKQLKKNKNNNIFKLFILFPLDLMGHLNYKVRNVIIHELNFILWKNFVRISESN
tara:strand:- start:3051 stop:3284 length:234 start_codon:yes stop_codon:yes gene_type:complete